MSWAFDRIYLRYRISNSSRLSHACNNNTLQDYDAQTRLELVHRGDEDNLYRKFSEHRAQEDSEFHRETKVSSA